MTLIIHQNNASHVKNGRLRSMLDLKLTPGFWYPEQTPPFSPILVGQPVLEGRLHSHLFGLPADIAAGHLCSHSSLQLRQLQQLLPISRLLS